MNKLQVREDSQNYAATVVEITNIHDIAGADKIKRTTVEGCNIVVGLDTKVGDKMLWFCAGTQLSEQYCKFNNLYETVSENQNPEKKGYISFKRRLVKAIKLRGIESNGILLPLSSLDYIGETNLEIGSSFTSIDEIEICKKYEIQRKTNTNSQKKEPVAKLVEHLIPNQFRFHEETSHFAKNLHKFHWDSEIIISRKIHGSSGIVSHCLIKKDLTWKEKIAKFLGISVQEKEYGFVWSSGKPKSRLVKGLISDSKNWKTKNQSFYEEDIWLKAYNLLKDKTEKGITLYFEIIGEGIQGKDYTYGEKYKLYIYRITSTNVDGNVYEFSWNDMIKYCEKYNLQTVTQYFKGTFRVFGKQNKMKVSDPRSFNDVLDKLSELYLDKSYPDCAVDEGICIRDNYTNETFKLKSPKFLRKETEKLEKENEEDNTVVGD